MDAGINDLKGSGKGCYDSMSSRVGCMIVNNTIGAVDRRRVGMG